jgi:hypothetical protein
MHAARFAFVPTILLLVVVAASGVAPRVQQNPPPPVPPLEVPQESPAARTSLRVGTTDVEIAYHRPALRGRDVWKDFGATDVVWRLGANEATTISFTDPVKIAGKEIAAGTYALFAKVGGRDGTWTLLLNKNSKQWGAYFHDDKQDLLRFDVMPMKVEKREWFGISLDPKDADTATVSITWDTVQVSFDLDVDVDAIVARRIEKTLQQLGPKDWDTRLVVVKYWVGRNERLEEALDLITDAMEIQANFWTCEWKARTLHALGETEPALPLLDQAIADAKGKAPQGYIDGLVKLKADWSK